jgi:hypothetical protein
MALKFKKEARKVIGGGDEMGAMRYEFSSSIRQPTSLPEKAMPRIIIFPEYLL